MKLIKEEHNKSEQYLLDLISDAGLVSLSETNVAKIEAMLQIDSSYRKSSDKEAKPDGKYKGSTAYWMSELKKVLVDNETVLPDRYEEILKGAIDAVDRENSTHLNSDQKGPSEILERILGIEKEKLIEHLRTPKKDNYWLIYEISRRTNPTGISPTGKPYVGRENLSFASKFCHYACFYLFEDKEEQDNYSIIDGVLIKVLPRYLKYYNITKKYNLKNYKDYQEAVDEIRNKAGARISRNGFDHLLWYYYKGM